MSTSVIDAVLSEEVAERLDTISNVLYVLFGLMFVGGLYIDWRTPGLVVVPQFSVVNDPYANSGLFLLAILTVVIGYLISKAADVIEEMNSEEFDQTQEWIVNINGLDTDPGTRRERATDAENEG